MQVSKFALYSVLAIVGSVAFAADPPLKPTPGKDELFSHTKPYPLCIDPIKSPNCQNACTDMTLYYERKVHVEGRDRNTERNFAKFSHFDVKGLKQRKLKIPTASPSNPKEVKFTTSTVSPLPEEKGMVKDWFTHEDSVVNDQEYLSDKEGNYLYDKAGNPIRTPGVEPDSPDYVKTYEVGDPEAGKTCKWATIWVHGATPVDGGLGFSDDLFGGAFNQMKRQAQFNNGMYYSPTVHDSAKIKTLIQYIRAKSCPNGKIILNCGSAGASHCQQLAADKSMVKDIQGMVLIGSGWEPSANEFLTSDFAKARIPLLISQGSGDPHEAMRASVTAIHKKDPTYPIRFILFDSPPHRKWINGKDKPPNLAPHMAPLRALDWRETMNCMLTQAPDFDGKAAPASGSTGSPSVSQ